MKRKNKNINKKILPLSWRIQLKPKEKKRKSVSIKDWNENKKNKRAFQYTRLLEEASQNLEEKKGNGVTKVWMKKTRKTKQKEQKNFNFTHLPEEAQIPKRRN